MDADGDGSAPVDAAGDTTTVELVADALAATVEVG